MEQIQGDQNAENHTNNEFVETARWETRSNEEQSIGIKQSFNESSPNPYRSAFNIADKQRNLNLERYQDETHSANQVQKMNKPPIIINTKQLKQKPLPENMKSNVFKVMEKKMKEPTEQSNQFIEKAELAAKNIQNQRMVKSSIDDDYLNNDSGLVGFDLRECESCKRKFIAERLDKHSKVCAKLKMKRQIFNSKLKRTDGTISYSEIQHSTRIRKPLKKTPDDLDVYSINPLPNYNTPDQIPSTATTNHQKRAKWKVNHQNFIKSIRSARVEVDDPNKPYQASIQNPDYVYCKFCQRRFAPNVAAVHTPKCEHIYNRPKPPSQRKTSFLKVINNSLQKKQVKRFSYEPRQSNYGMKPRKLEPLQIVPKQSQLRSIHVGPPTKPKLSILEQPETFTGILKNYQNVEIRSSNYSNIECPHCSRKFADKAAERHIPICQQLTKQRNSLLKQMKDKKGEKHKQREKEREVEKQKQREKQTSFKLEINSLGSCKHCSFKFSKGHKYCSNCGKKRGE